mgnify:CR=1 FL=1
MSDDLHQTSSGKRLDVISWDEFFMSVAIAAQRRSKDPNTQVGACIANTNHRILSVGYNGTPSALNDDFFPWGTSDDPLQDKHNYVVHAEANAVLNYRGSLKDLEGSTVYVTLFPCHDCAKILAQVGVGTIDQALLSVLPTRYATLRHYGLSLHRPPSFVFGVEYAKS